VDGLKSKPFFKALIDKDEADPKGQPLFLDLQTKLGYDFLEFSMLFTSSSNDFYSMAV
jgi:hypothetical protein